MKLLAGSVLVASTVFAGDVTLLETQLSDGDGLGAVDLVFANSDTLFVVRPSVNAMTRVEFDGVSMVSTIWQDDVANASNDDGGICDVMAPEFQTFCYDCETGSRMYRPMTDAVALNYAAGTLIVSRAEAWRGLGLYSTDMDLWYVCGAPHGEGQPKAISEYFVAPGALSTFALTYPIAGLQPVTGIVVGGVDPVSLNVRSRKGSGGATGGGGPYPGVDEEWTAPPTLASVGLQAAVGDFDQDGWEDLAIVHPGQDSISVLRFTSVSGTEKVPGGAVLQTHSVLATGPNPKRAAAGLIDGDALSDLVVATSSGALDLHAGDGTGFFGSTTHSWALPSAANGLEVIDVDGDGFDEILAVGAHADGTGWLMIAGVDEGLATSQVFALEGAVEALAVNSFGGAAAAAIVRESPAHQESRVHWFVGGEQTLLEDLGSVTAIGGGNGVTIGLDDGRVFYLAGPTSDLVECLPVNASKPVSVGGGFNTSVAAYEDGTVVACEPGSVPGDLGFVTQLDVSDHVIALQDDGTVRCWGSNFSGECDVPVGLSDVVMVSAGGGFSAALKSDGTVVCWGENWAGQCNVPVGLSDVAKIEATFADTVALTSDGTVVAWGGYIEGSIPDDLLPAVDIATADLDVIVRFEDGSIATHGSSGDINLPAGTTGDVKAMVGTTFDIVVLDNVPGQLTASLLEFEPKATLPGDLNGDGQITGADLGLLLASWGPCVDCAADLNNDDEVTGADLGLLLAGWS